MGWTRSTLGYALAWNDLGDAIGTARMQAKGTIVRMAVLKAWRGRTRPPSNVAGSGGETRPLRVTLAAQTHALGFYE